MAAVAMGASIIEKHFTLDRTMEGRTTRSRSNWTSLREQVVAREVESALGDGESSARA